MKGIFMHEGHGRIVRKIIFAGALGAALGAIAGIIFSPRSGKENREEVSNWMHDMSRELKKRVYETKEITREKYDEVIDNLTSKYKKMREIKENEIDDFALELKNRWQRIQDRLNR